ncbi:hypothetical protein BC962_2209 [Gillisia mitskevichiae]|uniref:Uncharacterized protein n=1 Tax=Gillisia mitskevichiae TaxID=270921 RepID=A0A495PWK2_9FLAO|nr:hypothetical protein BC962_2209 [Gillisia mitskevichiae]
MRKSATFISFMAMVHLGFIDIIFLLMPFPTINYFILVSYNIAWFLIVFLIWNHSYNQSRS